MANLTNIRYHGSQFVDELDGYVVRTSANGRLLIRVETEAGWRTLRNVRPESVTAKA